MQQQEQQQYPNQNICLKRTCIDANSQKYVLSSLDLFKRCIQSISESVPLQSEFCNTKSYSLNKIKYTIINHIVKDDINTVDKEENIQTENHDIIESKLLRSVIINPENNVVGFSPTKSWDVCQFLLLFPSLSSPDIIVQEFIEGFMINVFFDPVADSWQIATRNTVGGNVSYYRNDEGHTKTFAEMFNEACIEHNVVIDNLDKQYCYSFVVKHKDNRIVSFVDRPELYLIEIYHILNDDSGKITVRSFTVAEIAETEIVKSTNILRPAIIQCDSYDDICVKYTSYNTPFNIKGVVVKNEKSLIRCKYLNPTYMWAKFLRGNQPKLQYHYLTLVQSGFVNDFLMFFPDMTEQINKYTNELNTYIQELYTTYVDCHIKHTIKFGQINGKYKQHVINLHDQYCTHLRPYKLKINKDVVAQYVVNIPTSVLMHSINYNKKKIHTQQDVETRPMTE